MSVLKKERESIRGKRRGEVLPPDCGSHIEAVIEAEGASSSTLLVTPSPVLQGVLPADCVRCGVRGLVLHCAVDELAARLVLVEGRPILLVAALNPVTVDVEGEGVDELSQSLVGVGIGGEFVQGESGAAGPEVFEDSDEDDCPVGRL